jgi:SAM-dependent methyltransferase
MVDKEYWDRFYREGGAPTEGSPFAQDVLQVVSKDEPLFELGCGNGRDAIFFAQNGIHVVGCDLSQTSIRQLQKKSQEAQHLNFLCEDFTALDAPINPELLKRNISDSGDASTTNGVPLSDYGTVYSRFTLHAIRKEGASRAIKWAFNILKPKGIFLLEARSVLDPLCGQGTKVEGEEDAWINTHYRRFIRKDQLLAELEEVGFTIEKVVESNGLAVYKEEDPVVIRVFARK